MICWFFFLYHQHYADLLWGCSLHCTVNKSKHIFTPYICQQVPDFTLRQKNSIPSQEDSTLSQENSRLSQEDSRLSQDDSRLSKKKLQTVPRGLQTKPRRLQTKSRVFQTEPREFQTEPIGLQTAPRRPHNETNGLMAWVKKTIDKDQKTLGWCQRTLGWTKRPLDREDSNQPVRGVQNDDKWSYGCDRDASCSGLQSEDSWLLAEARGQESLPLGWIVVYTVYSGSSGNFRGPDAWFGSRSTLFNPNPRGQGP